MLIGNIHLNMNKNLQSPTKLTEFAPLQPEEKQQTVGQFISKLFKLNKNSPVADGESSNHKREYENEPSGSIPTWAIETTADDDTRSNSYYEEDIAEERSLPNVLKRISNLLALKNSNVQTYSDADLKKYWMPDAVSKECYECGEKFTTFKRRHHCRVCGNTFCSQCCSQQIPGKIFGRIGDLRVCTYCYKVALRYLNSPEVGADLRVLQENYMSKLCTALPVGLSLPFNTSTHSISSDNSLDTTGTIRRKISVGYQEEKFALGRSGNSTYLSPEEKCQVLQNSSSLRNVYDEMCRPTTGILLQNHQYRLRKYVDCFLGSELVDWLIYHQKAKTRVQASAICQALLEGNYIESLSEPCSFIDGYALYKLGLFPCDCTASTMPIDVATQNDPRWMEEIDDVESITDAPNQLKDHFSTSSSFTLDLNVEANIVYLSKPLPSMHNLHAVDNYEVDEEIVCEEAPAVKTSEYRELVPESGWYHPSHLRDDNGEKIAYNLLTNAFQTHEENLLNQLLAVNGLPKSWNQIISSLTHEIVNIIKPDKNHDAEDIDIRQYVQFKKVCGGTRSDSRLIQGVVCSKNIAHKSMFKKLDNPQILLLQCPLMYQRTEGRLMSLEPIMLQEYEYLRNIVARIVALKPSIVLVQRNVSRLAQELLLDEGITLVFNVKHTVLERLSRCTQADIVTSMDTHIGRPKLGACKSFYLKTYDVEDNKKTLMIFEGFPMSHLGSTVLLRGGSKQELIKVKSVCLFFLFTCYNWRLEKSFLMDEFAVPPDCKDEFFDDSKETSPNVDVNKVETIEEQSKFELENNLIDEDTIFKCDKSDEFIDQINKPYPKLLKTNTKTSKNEITKKSIEDRRNIAELIDDFSDPLLSGIVENNLYKTNNNEVFAVSELPFSNDFRKALDDVILCISPYLVFPLPYLETETGRKCKLRSFFPTDIFFSSQIENFKKVKCSKSVEDDRNNNITTLNLKPSHPFVTSKFCASADSNEFQSLLANFRACGGRLEYKSRIRDSCSEQSIKERPNLIVNSTGTHLDALNPLSHQKLALLFCSFSRLSNNAPAFCVKMVVHMEFYGVNDIPLGCFLERYCFRTTYKCPSETCDTPMLKHIRRFVHNGACLSLALNNCESKFSEEGIFMWTWCNVCQKVSPVVPMSVDTWSFSFAKYLELRFYGGIYTRRGNTSCEHKLHYDHYQCFGYKNMVASFKYSPVQLWEISLPPKTIEIFYDNTGHQRGLIEDMKSLASKGHEIYSLITEKLASLSNDVDGLTTLNQILLKERAIFKQMIDEIQIKLTSPTLEQKSTTFLSYNIVWQIEDGIVRIKRLITELVEQWNMRFLELTKKKDSDKKKEKINTADIDNSKLIDEHIDNKADNTSVENSAQHTTKKTASFDSDNTTEGTASTLQIHQRSHSDGPILSQYVDNNEIKREGDKISVKTILSQLLPSNIIINPLQQPYNQQEHYTLPTGVLFPVVVYESEPSSIVAYTLNSFDYKKMFEEFTNKKLPSTEPSPSPVHKRRTHSEKERTESGEFSSFEKGSGILSFLRSKESKADLLNSVQSERSVPADSGNQVEDTTDDSKKLKSNHFEVQFSDHNTSFFCRVYYAERFSWLRSNVLSDGEESYIRSLSRCVPWNAQGGKSGSTFCKTKDDRFILKEMPKSEMQLFLDSANNYFLYMEKCFSSSQPTLLGKIVGIYQVMFRNTSTNVTLRTYFLVMENLFYNRVVTHKFDLKGSMRNRFVNSDHQDGEIVLLDENLLKMTCDTPLYILPHSKAVLTAAIQNDTEFLSEQSVMDYSLLVGLDSDNKELVLGIIDYIRTFTWDKKLETMVKKTGILGGQGKLPTIISPKEYRKRFIEAMHRYFLVVPDHWAELGQGLEC